MATDTVPREKWWKIQWYSDDDTPDEREFIIKLDLIVVPYAVLAYWVKYIDQAKLNNAYVGGMKEELSFKGNELVELQTMYTVGAVVGMIPFMFIFTYIPMYWTIPAMDILWGLFTILHTAHIHSERWLPTASWLVSSRPLSFQQCTMSLALGTDDMRSPGEAASFTLD